MGSKVILTYADYAALRPRFFHAFPSPRPFHLRLRPLALTLAPASLPGCYSQGDTVDEALANIKEAIELCLEDMQAQGEEIPDPSRLLIGSVVVTACAISITALRHREAGSSAHQRSAG